MPHKTNPKNFENIKSLWKAFVPRMLTVYLDGISEHQRDLTNSASGRFLLETFVALDYASVRMREALGQITVNLDAMTRNLEHAAESVMAEPLYILLALYGKEADAYDKVRELVRASERNNRSLAAEVRATEELQPLLRRVPDDKRAMLDDPSGYIGYAVDRTHQICGHWELQLEGLRLP
jgi:adenylosuccinate lyase